MLICFICYCCYYWIFCIFLLNMILIINYCNCDCWWTITATTTSPQLLGLLNEQRYGWCGIIELVRWVVLIIVDVRQWPRLSDKTLRRPRSRLVVVTGEVVALRPVRDVSRHQRTASRQRAACPTGRRRLVQARQKQNVTLGQRTFTCVDRPHSGKNH